MIRIAGLCLAVGLMAAAPAFGQGFTVPDGFIVETDPANGAVLARVRPLDGPFAGLSTIELRAVDEDIADTDAWLRAQMSADIGDEVALEALFDSPDSPFSDPVFGLLRSGLKKIAEELARLGQLPLEFCDEPRAGHNAAGDFRELICTIDMGPIKQYYVLRLQRAGGVWYYTAIRTMNQRRLRHLVAIANSFATE
jgi:hypothetical protein